MSPDVVPDAYCLNCVKFRRRLGLCPRLHWGAHSAPTDPLAAFKGGGREERMGGEGKGGKERGGEGEEGRE